MSCDQSFAIDQISRLTGLESFPEVPAAANELVIALATAPTNAAALRFVSDWLRTQTRAPRPAEIYAALEPLPAFATLKPYACAECSDSGWIIVLRGDEHYAKPCACRASASDAPDARMKPI